MLVVSRQAAQLVGIENWQVQSYAKQGFVDSAVRVRGAGSRRKYDLNALIRLAVLARLVEDGIDLRTIRPIFAELFDALPSSDDPRELARRLESWFRQKVLVTSRCFTIRKLTTPERLGGVVDALLQDQHGIYILHIGAVTTALLDRYRTLLRSD